MANYIKIFIVVIMVVVQVQPREIQSVSNLGPSYDELVYILQKRHGVTATPPRRLTPCARAIIACCQEKTINEGCSERLKCGAYFFDDNPCEDKFIIEALEAAKLFYEQFNTIKV